MIWFFGALAQPIFRLLNFPETIFNVPSSSGSDQLNLLVNKAAEEIIGNCLLETLQIT